MQESERLSYFKVTRMGNGALRLGRGVRAKMMLTSMLSAQENVGT